MELTQSDENFDYVYFDHVKDLNNCDALCIICKTQEKGSQRWTRYQIQCGCIGHSRCMRKYLGEKKALHCPKCDKYLEISEKTRCCGNCGEFGHSMGVCDIKQEQKNTLLMLCKKCHTTAVIFEDDDLNCLVCKSVMEIIC